MSVEALEQLKSDITAVEKSLAELSAAKRAQACRAATFRDFFGVAGDDMAADSKARLEAMIASAQTSEKFIESAIEDAKVRRAALEELSKIFVPQKTAAKITPPIPPPRKPNYDYTHKDLRESSELYTVREFIRKKGKPVLLNEIVADGLGFKGEMAYGFDAKYASLRGTLTGYANESRIFTIESKSPHVIGLIEFNELSGGFKTRL